MRALLALIALAALPVLAAEPVAAPVAVPLAGDGGAAGQLARLVLGLLLVIGLIFLFGWLLRRVQQMAPRKGQVIRILAVQALGPRDRLILVQVGEEQVLLGLAGGRITPLHVMKESVHLPDAEPATPEFAQRLMELLGKDNKDNSR